MMCFSRDQEVQGIGRGRPNREKDDEKGGQDAEHPQGPLSRSHDRGIQKVSQSIKGSKFEI